jgi:hypothetical protein
VSAPAKYDVVDAIMRYEEDEATHEEVLELFQHLVDTGAAWKLQGSYGRMANNLIEQGYITDPASG